MQMIRQDADRVRAEGACRGIFIESAEPLGGGLADWPDAGVGPDGYRFVDDAVAIGAARLLGALCASGADASPDAAITLFQACVRRAVASPRRTEMTGGATGYSATLGPARLRTVIEHVERTLPGPVRLAELAGLVHLPETHFCRSFGAATGATPLGYVRTRRVARA